MGRFSTAFRLFFRILSDRVVAEQAEALLKLGRLPAAPAEAQRPSPAPSPTPSPTPAAPPKREPTRSEALTLLAVLQREGRLVDFLQEDIAGYADAQVGAAVRDVHRDCRKALDRLFALRPLRTEPEGSSIDVPAGFDAARVRLTGNVAGPGPYRGALRHAGWEATKVELPEWTGSADSARVVAPAEVEVA